jgi:hypothetical protein
MRNNPSVVENGKSSPSCPILNIIRVASKIVSDRPLLPFKTAGYQSFKQQPDMTLDHREFRQYKLGDEEKRVS